eukprot:EG_transcript_5372
MAPDSNVDVSKVVTDEDEMRLAKLGYKQEYARIFNKWTNFGLTSSMVSVLLGIVPLYTNSLTNGGSTIMVWSWVIVGLMTMFVVTSLAEICAAYPTMGALYFWAYRLGGREWGPFAAWTAGWCNLLGQIGGVASGGYSGAQVIGEIVTITSGTKLDKPALLGIYAACLVVAGIVNTLSDTMLKGLCYISVVWHIVGVVVIIALMNCYAPTHQTVGWVLGNFNNDSGFSNFYAGLVGLLAAASTYTGYDTGAHVAEETCNSHNSTPLAMIGAVVNCLVLGLILIIGMNFAIQDVSALTDGNNAVGAASTLWVALMGVPLAVFCNVITFVAIECSNCANMTSAARMVYSFSRDGALPFSRYWYNVNRWSGSPVRAIAFSVIASFLVGVPSLANDTVLQALFSLTGTGLLASYITAIFLRITVSRHTFQPAEFNLGRWSIPCGVISVVWSLFMLVVLCLPAKNPIAADTLNYAPVMLGGTIIGSWIVWIFSARHWFKGIPDGVESSATSETEDDLVVKQDRDAEGADEVGGELLNEMQVELPNHDLPPSGASVPSSPTFY